MNDTFPRTSWRRAFGVFFTVVACLGILAASVAAIVMINRTEPTAQQINATRRSAALVETVVVRRGTWSPRIAVLGTVQAAQDIVLSPRVEGQVTEISPKFVPGELVSAGDLILQIDPADFENAVAIRESELLQAEASLEIEEGRQTLAKKELELLEESIDQVNRALVLREPQIASIRAEVAAALAAVERARLDLERTRICAPFDAQILTRSANVGSQVAPGEELARLVGVREYWIMAAVPVRSLRWIEFPDNDRTGSTVILSDADAWPPGAERPAQVSRLIGALDEQTRLARVLITVPDPLGLESDVPPLILDTLIETTIEGQPIENVVRLEREYVRDQDTVWVLKNDALEIRKVAVVFRDAEYAYISEGLDDLDEVVITTLSTVADGVGLRRIAGDPAGESSTDAASAQEVQQ